MIFDHVESFHRKSLFYTCFKKFWVAENSFPIVTNLNKINSKKSQKYFNFQLYQIIYENSSEVTNFVFKSKTRSCIGFSKTLICRTSKRCERRYFTGHTLIDSISFLITKCLFTIGSLAFKQ